MRITLDALAWGKGVGQEPVLAIEGVPIPMLCKEKYPQLDLLQEPSHPQHAHRYPSPAHLRHMWGTAQGDMGEDPTGRVHHQAPSSLPACPKDITLAAKHDHDVCLATVYLGEGERGHIAPHLECPSEGVINHSTVQVRGVVYHPAREAEGQCSQAPPSCRSYPVLGRSRPPPTEVTAVTTTLDLFQGSGALLGIR